MIEPLTDEERAEAVTICDEATEGPWEIGRAAAGDIDIIGPCAYSCMGGLDVDEADAVFIARSRDLLPKALAKIDELEKALLDVRASVGYY